MSEPHESGTRSRRWLWPPLVVAAVGIAVAGYYFLGRGVEPLPSAATTPTTAVSAGVTTPAVAPSSAPATPSPSPKPSKRTPAPTKPATNNPLSELDPVDLGSDSERAGGVVVSLDQVESVAGEATMPGDVAGPALRLTILVRNGGTTEISLDTVVVNGYRDSDRTPLESLVEPGGKPFGGKLAPGGEARGVYIFRAGTSQRADVTFTVDLQAGQPASVFRGDAR